MSAKITISEFTQAIFATVKKYWSEKRTKKEQKKAREKARESYREYLKGLSGRELEKLEKSLQKEKTIIEERGDGSDAKAQEWHAINDQLEAVLDEQSRRDGIRTGYDHRLEWRRLARSEKYGVIFMMTLFAIFILALFFLTLSN